MSLFLSVHIKDFFKPLFEKVSLIFSKIVHWLGKPKWLNRLTFYFIIFAFVNIVMHFVFNVVGLLHTNPDSARYMLSALIQSEATIIALVVTLSLIAVQLTASSYSARVIDVFKKTPDLWVLMGIYGFAMFYGLGVLKLIDNANQQLNGLSNLEIFISLTYYIGVFAFLALGLYIRNTFNLLKPSMLINLLADEIKNKNGIFDIEKSADEDPTQPIIDMVRASLIKYDHETVKEGLRAIRDIFKNKTFRKERKYYQTKEGRVSYFFEREKGREFDHFFARLARIGKISSSNKDEDSTLEIITNLREIGLNAAKKNLEEATYYAINALREIGKNSAEQKLEKATILAVYALEVIGIAAVEDLNFVRLTWNAECAIKEIKKMADKQKLDDDYIKSINEVLNKLSKYNE